MLKHEHILEEEQDVNASQERELMGIFLEAGVQPEYLEQLENLIKSGSDHPMNQEVVPEIGYVDEDGNKISPMSFVPGTLQVNLTEEEDPTVLAGLPRVIRPTYKYSGMFISHQRNPVVSENGVKHADDCVCRACRRNAIEVPVWVDDLEEIIGPNKSTGWVKRSELQAHEISLTDIDLLDKRKEFVNGSNGQRASLKALDDARRELRTARFARSSFSETTVYVSEGWTEKEGFKNSVLPIDSFLSGLVMPVLSGAMMRKFAQAAGQSTDLVAVSNYKKAVRDHQSYLELWGNDGSETKVARARWRRLKRLRRSKSRLVKLEKEMKLKGKILARKKKLLDKMGDVLWGKVEGLRTFEGKKITKEMLNAIPDENGVCALDETKRYLPYYLTRSKIAKEMAGIHFYNVEKDTVSTLVNKGNLGCFKVDHPSEGQTLTKYGSLEVAVGKDGNKTRQDVSASKIPPTGSLLTENPLKIADIEVSLRNADRLVKANNEEFPAEIQRIEKELAKVERSLKRCKKQETIEKKEEQIKELKGQLEAVEKRKATLDKLFFVDSKDKGLCILEVWFDTLKYMFAGRPSDWERTGFHVKLDAAVDSVHNTELYENKKEYIQDLHLEAMERLDLFKKISERGDSIQKRVEEAEAKVEAAKLAAEQDLRDKEYFFEEEYPRLGMKLKPLAETCEETGEPIGELEDAYTYMEDPAKLQSKHYYLTESDDPWYTCGTSFGGGVNSTEGELEDREGMEEAADRSEFDHNRNDDHYNDLLLTWILQRLSPLKDYVQKWQDKGVDVSLPWDNGINGFQKYCSEAGVEFFGERHNGKCATQTNLVWHETRELVKVSSRKRGDRTPAKFEMVTKSKTFSVESWDQTHNSENEPFMDTNKVKMFDVRIKLDALFGRLWNQLTEQVHGPRREQQATNSAHEKVAKRFEERGYEEGLWSC